MMISCKQSTELICQSLDRPLTLWERVQLRLHLMMCRGCMAFRRQSQALDQLIEQRFHALTDDHLAELEGLSEGACERLKTRLRQAARQPPSPD